MGWWRGRKRDARCKTNDASIAIAIAMGQIKTTTTTTKMMIINIIINIMYNLVIRRIGVIGNRRSSAIILCRESLLVRFACIIGSHASRISMHCYIKVRVRVRSQLSSSSLSH